MSNKFKLNKDFVEELLILIEKKDEKLIVNKLKGIHAADIADIIEILEHEKANFLFDIIDNPKSADIIVVAIGRPLFLTEDMVKEGAVIIDVGIHRINDETKKNGFRLIGDVDFDNVAPKTSYITPVPGGVGPMTIASLLLNTCKSTYGEDN